MIPNQMKILLEQKDVNVNVKGQHGVSPLHIAPEKAYTECIKLLLVENDI